MSRREFKLFYHFIEFTQDTQERDSYKHADYFET